MRSNWWIGGRRWTVARVWIGSSQSCLTLRFAVLVWSRQVVIFVMVCAAGGIGWCVVLVGSFGEEVK